MKIQIKTQAETEAIARQIAQIADIGDAIALYGDLGVGKSVFSRAFIRALTSADEEVPSPTFTLVQIYDSELGELYHFDMYRLESPHDCLELGIEEAFADGVSLIEWPTKMGAYLPWDCLKLEISHGGSDTERVMELTSQGSWLDRLKEAGLG